MSMSSYLLLVQNLRIATRRAKGPKPSGLHHYPYHVLDVSGHLGSQPCETGEQHEVCCRGYSTFYAAQESSAFANKLRFRYKWVVFSHSYTIISVFSLSTHTELWGIQVSREVIWQINVEIKFTPKKDCCSFTGNIRKAWGSSKCEIRTIREQ